MDYLEFLAKSEWPIVAGLALWICRQPLQSMLNRINPTKIDAWGFKAEFERGITKAEILTSSQTLQSETAQIVKPEPITPKIKLDLTKPPETRILRSWNNFVRALAQAAGSAGLRFEQNTDDEWVSLAAKEFGFTLDEISAIQELQNLRNRVAHTPGAPISEQEADRFETVCSQLRFQITEKAKAQSGTG